MKKKIFVMLMILILIFSVASCSDETSQGKPKAGVYPMTFTDSSGKVIEFESEPQKIISLAPNCTETLFAIGAGDKVIGVSDWCNYPEEALALPKVGSTYGVNLEKIIELEPDLVIVSGLMGADAVTSLETAGIKIVNMLYAEIDDLYSGIEDMGIITNRYDKATALNDQLKADLKTLQDSLDKKPTKKVFIDFGDLYTSSKMDFLGNTIQLLKAENIAYDIEQSSPQLSAEKVIESNPDVYIYTGPESTFQKPAGFEEINAFKNNEVYYIDYTDPLSDIILRQSPRFVEGLKELAKMIHPQ